MDFLFFVMSAGLLLCFCRLKDRVYGISVSRCTFFSGVKIVFYNQNLTKI